MVEQGKAHLGEASAAAGNPAAFHANYTAALELLEVLRLSSPHLLTPHHTTHLLTAPPLRVGSTVVRSKSASNIISLKAVVKEVHGKTVSLFREFSSENCMSHTFRHAVQCSAVQCSAVQSGAVQCSAVQCTETPQ